jgi:hypothetical protein
MGESLGKGKVEVKPGMTIFDLKKHLKEKTGKLFEIFVKQTFMPSAIARLEDLATCFGIRSSSGVWTLDVKASREVTWG